jgi:hypothetical protein
MLLENILGKNIGNMRNKLGMNAFGTQFEHIKDMKVPINLKPNGSNKAKEKEQQQGAML